jgi:hypoxanthine phosphoribosyltransferase
VIVANPFQDTFELVRVLYTEQQIADRVKTLAMAIDNAYQRPEASQLVLLGALTGAYVFLSDLSRAVQTPHTIQFVRASSYHGGTDTSGEVKVGSELKDLQLEGKDVVIVEDILDTGLTYQTLRDELRKECRPASIEFCAMLSKPDKLKAKGLDINDKFIGFQLRPPRFVVGYGLDYRDHFRGLPFIAEAREI